MKRKIKTQVCEQIGIDIPIFQGPMGGATTPTLAAAVANRGGLGMLPLGTKPLNLCRDMIQKTKALTNKKLGVNLVLEWDQHERLKMSLDEGVDIIWFFWGDPAPYIKDIHKQGAKVIHTVGSAEEAKQSVDVGTDVIVAQGWEAGGHVWGEVASLPLIPAVVDVVGGIPVIAAGGIGDGRGMAAALTLGADGIVLGTRLLASLEAGIHTSYKEKVIQAKETDTVYTDLFDIGWPNSWMRVLKNTTFQQWEQADRPKSGNRPGEDDTITQLASGKDVPRYSYLLPLAAMSGDLEPMAHYAGQSSVLVKRIQSVDEIFTEVLREAVESLEHAVSLLA